VGLAFDATLLWIRADIDGSCETQCAVRGNDLARGIDYALAHGAKVIGVPLTGSKRLRSVEAALDRAVAAGAIIVAAAGNDGSAAPSWPALYAANPRFSRSFVVAGASTPSGRMARWSNKAAGVERRYIAAPGENVIVDCGDKYCSLVSGTSYSVAYVAGALALILQAHPELAAPDAADILLRTATDLGRRGVDQVSGAGRLNVARAIRGARSVADVQGPGT
jgi:subtilisin family serine protease